MFFRPIRTAARCVSVFSLVVFCLTGRAADFSPEGLEFFEKKIRPVLADKCYKCHSTQSDKVKGGLLLDSRDALRKGGESGPALVPGKPEESLLIKAIHYEDDELQMPPKEQLTDGQIKDFEAWIKMGAPDPRKGVEVAAAKPIYDFDKEKKFWSYQPVKDAVPPKVRSVAWVKSPIDSFILAKLEAKGLTPSRPADKRTLLRRATYDLTGLPPTPAEMDAFLNDRSPQAFEKVIDRLLASPAYGAQWGRHWLDVVRYADTSGCNSDYPVPAAYKYRNWVIDAFNRDKPYHEFLREQIAGDLLSAADPQDRFEKVIATGYLAIARRFGSRNNEFHLTIEDTIDNVGKAMLGLSVSCARCHDHKFDPIPTRDYYALYGIFSSTRYAFPGTEIYKFPKDMVPLTTNAVEAGELFRKQLELATLDDRLEDLKREKRALTPRKDPKTNLVADASVAIDGNDEKVLKGEKVAPRIALDGEGQAKAKGMGRLPEKSKRTLEEVKDELEEVEIKLRQREAKALVFNKAYAVSEGKPANARIQRKGEPNNLGDEAPRGFLQILGGQTLQHGNNSGRDELAGWICDARNPLTARVMVNRIWQHHFGKGIVQSPNDFGVRGKAPTHPELLDYLATRFVENGWSIKALHKRIMLSQVYQLSCEDNAKNSLADVNNELLWKFNRRRLSAEEIRDSVLTVSGSLDRTMAGPHPFSPDNEYKFTQHKPFYAVYSTDKRSIYLMQQRIKKQPFLEVFDGADPNATTADRPLSTTAIQALFMLNAPFMHEQADKLAVRVGMAFPEESHRIEHAYRLALGRFPSREEMRWGQEYLQQGRDSLKESGTPGEQLQRGALASYMRVLLSSNEFLFIE